MRCYTHGKSELNFDFYLLFTPQKCESVKASISSNFAKDVQRFIFKTPIRSFPRLALSRSGPKSSFIMEANSLNQGFLNSSFLVFEKLRCKFFFYPLKLRVNLEFSHSEDFPLVSTRTFHLFCYWFTMTGIKKHSCYLHTRHVWHILKRAEPGFLITLLAYGVYIGLLLPDPTACTHSCKRLCAKCQISWSCSKLYLSQLYSHLYKTWYNIILAEHKPKLLISSSGSIFK